MRQLRELINRHRKAIMTTKELIDAANAAKTADATAAEQLAAAQAAKDASASASTAADKALHDDLSANGPAVTVSADTPPVVVIYKAADPDSFTSETVRVA